MYHDPDFSIIPHLLSDSPICIDVGANAGQSICSIKISRPNAIIHSFEPNPEYRQALSSFESRFDDVHVYDVGLGSKESLIDFYIPVVNGVRYPEGATMRLEALNEPWVVERYFKLGGVPSFEKFSRQVLLGDRYKFNPELIKIDVEGAESDVVVGFYETIRRCRPIFMVENGDWTRLHNIIERLNYVPMMPNSNYRYLIPFSGHRANTFYIPI